MISWIGQPSKTAFLTSVPTDGRNDKILLIEKPEGGELTARTNVKQDSPVAFFEEAECLLITRQGRSLEAGEVEMTDTVIAINLQ
jgi:hypothetical protein